MVRTLESPGNGRFYWLTSRLARYFSENAIIGRSEIEEIMNYTEPENITPPAGGNPLPSAPRSFAAVTGDASGEIDLSWTVPEFGAPFTAYFLWVSEDGSNWEIVTGITIDGTATSYTAIGITAGAERSYRLSAENASGTGPLSAIATANAGS